MMLRSVVMVFLLCVWSAQASVAPKLRLGADLFEQYGDQLKDKRVGLIVNQTSRVGEAHLVDFLLQQEVNVSLIFAPEHGFRGDHDAGQTVESTRDHKTGIQLFSIYGKNKKPPAEIMDEIDVVIFDIQDVGARFYTYISSMHYMMEAAAEQGVEFIVLDRPNPNGKFVAGPIRQAGFTSFVGMHPIPLLHGMTVAELARMIKGEGWINQADELKLSTIAMQGYQRDLAYGLPVAPSPNLPNARSVELYPSLCLFEPTEVSIGRGTDMPFQVVGAKDIVLGDFAFTPRSIPGAASNPKLKGVKLNGLDLREENLEGFDITLLYKVYHQYASQQKAFFTSPAFFDKLAGTDRLRIQLQAGVSQQEIERSWQADIQAFRHMRKDYLLYPDM